MTPSSEPEGVKRRSRFGNVDARVIECVGVLSQNAKQLYTLLACHAGGDRDAITKRRYLARRMEVSVDTLDRAMAQLRTVGVVEVVGRVRPDGSQGANFYRLNDFEYLPPVIAAAQPDDDEQEGGRTGAQGGGRTGAAGGAARVRHQRTTPL